MGIGGCAIGTGTGTGLWTKVAWGIIGLACGTGTFWGGTYETVLGGTYEAVVGGTYEAVAGGVITVPLGLWTITFFYLEHIQSFFLELLLF